MLDWQNHKKLRIFTKTICIVLVVSFLSYDFSWAGASEVLSPKILPSFSQIPFVPPTLKYLSVNEANPHNYFNFLLDKGQLSVVDKNSLNREAKQLINYFFLGITLSDDVFWVNLKPTEPDRITSEQLSKTDLGRTLLEQDFRLKRDVSQYLNPRSPMGKQFWEKLYSTLGKDKVKKASITTSNRVWIVPNEAVVLETEDGVLLAKSSLKVLLESEYAALENNKLVKQGSLPQQPLNPDRPSDASLQALTERLMKEIVIPAITKDVNESQNYAPLRQIYHSLILAQWFKRKHKNANSVYAQAVNKGYLKGLESSLPWEKQQIWQDYLKSYNQGEYRIKDTIFGLKRMYFSGGVVINLGAVSSPMVIIEQKELPKLLEQDPDYLNELMEPDSFKNELVVLTERPASQENSSQPSLVQDIDVKTILKEISPETAFAKKEKPLEIETSSPIIDVKPSQETIVNPAPVIPKRPALFGRFIDFISSLKSKPIKLFLNKRELDRLLDLLSQDQKQQLFERLDSLVQKISFENLNVNQRYVFIKLLTYVGQESIKSSMGLMRDIKRKLLELLEKQESLTFAEIAKHIVLPIVEKEDYTGFNNTIPMVNMPKILLIGSYMCKNIRTGLFVAPHLGLHRIASFLELFGIQADVYDVDLSGTEKLEEIVKEGKYDFIGFEVLHLALRNNLELIYKVHKLSPDSILVAGGQGATFNYSLLLEKTPIDIVVRGFGEFPLLNMITMFNKNEPLSEQFNQIKGIYLKDEVGKIVSTGFVLLYTLDDLRVLSLGLDFTKIPYEEYWSAVGKMYSHSHMKMMKGEIKVIRLYCESHCPMGCDFCSTTRFLDDAIGMIQKVRILSAKDILLLLKRAIKAYPDAEAFYFNDDDFLINRQRILDLSELIEKELKEQNLKFICMARADRVNPELLSKMNQAGFKIINYGIESFSDKILRDIGKKLKGSSRGEVAEQAIRETFRAGIIPRINFIMFYPTTTMEDLRITIDKAVELINEGAPPTHYNYVEPFPGANILSKGYEMRYEEFEVEGEKFKIPVEILPVDKEIKQLAKEAIVLKPQVLQQIKDSYNWPYSTLPSVIDTLAFFYAIYKKANISTTRIEEVIDKFMKKSDDSVESQTSKYTAQDIEIVIKALEDLEYKTKETIAKANQILISKRKRGSSINVEVAKLLKDIIEEIRESLREEPLRNFDEESFEDLPQENAFGEPEEPISPRVIYKSLLLTLNYAKKELELILDRQDIKIRSLLLINGNRKLQVGSKGFEFVKSKGWQGWVVKIAPSSKKYSYKDLIIEEIPGILSGLTQDLRVTQNIMEGKDISIEEAFEQARKRRSAIIERGVNLYEGWDPEDRAYRTLRSRYALTLMKVSLISLAALAGFGYFFLGEPISFPLRVIDTAISGSLIGLLVYLVYLSTYGFFSESGRFRIHRDDLIRAIPKDILLEILSRRTKQRLKITDEVPLSSAEIIHKLSKDEFFESISNPITSICLLIHNLTRKKLLDILLSLGIDDSKLSKKEMSFHVLKTAIDLFQRNKELNDVEQKILKEIFPQQAIIIPAVNDPNIVELVSQKVTSVNYPNVIFFLALEERDKIILEIIQKAKKEGRLPPNVIPYFGPVLGPNNPGKQHKPLSKPKTVNNVIAQIQAVVEGLIEKPLIQIDKLPDFMMIWDLEDDPAELQIWSMIIADAMIKSTVDDLVERMKIGKGFDPNKVSLRVLRRADPELCKRALRWGIDLNLPKKLQAIYNSSLKRIQKENSDTKEKSLSLIRSIGIKSDINLLEQVRRGYEEVFFIQKRNHRYDPDPERLMKSYDKILEGLYQKYSSLEQFILSEFERRTIPANYQGSLVLKMFGENPLSPLEWILWFNLILGSLAAYRYDITIFPLMILGAWLGYGFYHLYGGVGGLILGGLVGLILGKLALLLGIDLRNKVSLAFSAGTTNNFSFSKLIYQLSGYPEYNVAEDWAIALKMAKMKFRTLLVDGYKTSTYEESLPSLGFRVRSCIRWWIQHSRWIGGHFQSIPQILHKPFKSIREFGPLNFIHSLILVIVLSFSGLLFGYVIFRTFCWLALFGIATAAEFFNISSLADFAQDALLESHKSFWWLFEFIVGSGPLVSFCLFILGPIIVIGLGILAILKGRPDEEELIDKSISDLERIANEFKNRSNSDIVTILQGIQRLDDIADELEVEKNSEGLLEIAENLEQMKGIKGNLWEDPKINPILIVKLKMLAKTQKPWEELRNIADRIEEELDKEIQREVARLESKIKKIEQGQLSFGIRIGKIRYVRFKKLIMNLTMPFYYFHTLPATLLYFSQIAKEMDSQWRQTPHRTYGEKFINIVANILKKKSYNDNRQRKERGEQMMGKNILKFILSFFFLANSSVISQADTQRLKKRTIDEDIFVSQEKLAIHNIIPNTQKLSQFETLEINVNLSATYNNPFDSDDISVDGHFVSPDGKHTVVPGFFYQNFIRDKVGNTERLTPEGSPIFKVRFASKNEGMWKYHITVRDRNGQIKSEEYSFEVIESANPGYIRVNPKNPYYFIFDSGRPYFAVGESIGWARRNRQTYDYDYFFNKLAENKCNYSRIWMVPWHLALEWTNKGHPKGRFYGLGKYCLENAWRLDHVLKLAEEKGIYIMLTLGNYGDLMQEKGIWNEQQWENNPYNITNDGPCEVPWDFFTNKQAKDYYKKRLRYIIARWGYSTHILSWELFNEVDAPAEWIREVAKFIKDNDPFGHLVTISLGYPDWSVKHPEEKEIWQLSDIDYTQLHIWGQGEPQDLIKKLVAKIIFRTKRFKKPVLVAEFGIDNSKDDRLYDKEGKGINLHNGLWAATMSGSFGGAINWWWDSYVEPNALYYHYKTLVNFTEDIDWTKRWRLAKVNFLQKDLEDKREIISNKIRILGLTTDTEAVLWIQNKESNWYNHYQGILPKPLENISFYLLGLSDAQYKLKWYDTYRGEVIEETKVFSVDGRLLIKVPQLERDSAIKISRINEDDLQKSQLNLYDSSRDDIATNPGGIDLSQIELTLKDEKFVSSLNPADLKILRAAKALKQGQNSLAVLYVHEVRLLLKDSILSEKDVTQKALLQNLLVQLEHRELLDPEALIFCHSF